MILDQYLSHNIVILMQNFIGTFYSKILKLSQKQESKDVSTALQG